MFLDTSAIIEILIDGPESKSLSELIKSSTTSCVTAPTVIYEATVVLAGKENISVAEAEEIVRGMLQTVKASILTVTDHTASLALDAFSRFGKGRHPARLNLAIASAMPVPRQPASDCSMSVAISR